MTEEIKLPKLFERLKHDKNIFRTYLYARGIHKKWISGEYTSELLNFANTVSIQLIMEYLNVNIETAEELLTMDVENGKSPLRIVDPYKAFVQLCSEFPNQKEMARKTGIQESAISMYKNKKRRMTVDKVVSLCRACNRKYVVE